MEKVTASKLKNCFGKYLDIALVEGGVYIVRHSRIIAKIVPVTRAESLYIPRSK